jgi:hypothetical protein
LAWFYSALDTSLIRFLRNGGSGWLTQTIGVSRRMPTLRSLDNLELFERYPIDFLEHFASPRFCASLIMAFV